jgi:peroxiredoxin
MSPSTAVAPLSLGDPAPAFGPLPGTDGRAYSLATFSDATVLVVVFVGNGCPTVRLYEQRLAELDCRYRSRGVRTVLVNSNNPYLSPPDAYQRMVERAERFSVPLSYLKDEGGALARSCGAICTPQAFAFDQERRLRYRGRIDDSRTGRRVTRDDLGRAIADMLDGRSPQVAETAPFGCAIVW